MLPAIPVYNKCCLQSASIAASLPQPQWCPWGDLGWRKTGYWPEIVKMHIQGMISFFFSRNDFNDPRLLHSLIKTLKSLIVNVCFSSNLLMFNYIFPQQNLLYILAPPWPLWSSSSELSGCPPAIVLNACSVTSNSLWPYEQEPTRRSLNKT